MTEHFSFHELTFSNTASQKGIDNTPSKQHEANLKRLAMELLEPLREAFNAPLKVSSAYRSEALNEAVKGAKSSQHLSGEAADLLAYCMPGESQRSANIRLFNIAKDMVHEGKLQVGQLIDEYNYSWVHVSLPRSGKPNNQILHLK